MTVKSGHEALEVLQVNWSMGQQLQIELRLSGHRPKRWLFQLAGWCSVNGEMEIIVLWHYFSLQG